jgi:hypothetical protein
MANLLNFFGFTIKRTEEEKQLPKSVVAPILQDGAVVVNQTGNGVVGD